MSRYSDADSVCGRGGTGFFFVAADADKAPPIVIAEKQTNNNLPIEFFIIKKQLGRLIIELYGYRKPEAGLFTNLRINRKNRPCADKRDCFSTILSVGNAPLLRDGNAYAEPETTGDRFRPTTKTGAIDLLHRIFIPKHLSPFHRPGIIFTFGDNPKHPNDMRTQIPKVDFTTLGPEDRIGLDIYDNDFAILDEPKKAPLYDYPSHIGVAAIGVCLEGSTTVSIDLKRYEVRANDMLIVLPGQIAQIHHRSADFRNSLLVLSSDYIKKSLFSAQQFLPLLFELKGRQCLRLSPDEVVRILEYHSFLRQKIRMRESRYKKMIAYSLLHAFLYEIADLFDHRKPIEIAPQSRKTELFRKFMEALQTHHKQERSVAFYADKLCLTSKHLSNVIKELTGKAAGEWIDSYVILEAKTLLRTTELTILQISEELNFANQSFFGKYFKLHTGMSPLRYRRS